MSKYQFYFSILRIIIFSRHLKRYQLWFHLVQMGTNFISRCCQYNSKKSEIYKHCLFHHQKCNFEREENEISENTSNHLAHNFFSLNFCHHRVKSCYLTILHSS